MSGIQTVLLVVYLLIVLAMIGVILLQRSEGGGLGMGGNAGGLMTVRGSANLLTRTTAILAALFFATAIGLTILSELDRGPTQGILDAAGSSTSEQPSNVLDALSQLQGDTSSSVEAPASASVSTDPGLALPVASVPASASASEAPSAASSASEAVASSAAPVSSVEASASTPPASSAPAEPSASVASSASAP